jgi:hypothetical protein
MADVSLDKNNHGQQTIAALRLVLTVDIYSKRILCYLGLDVPILMTQIIVA